MVVVLLFYFSLLSSLSQRLEHDVKLLVIRIVYWRNHITRHITRSLFDVYSRIVVLISLGKWGWKCFDWTTLDLLKFSLAVKLREHKRRKLNCVSLSKWISLKVANDDRMRRSTCSQSMTRKVSGNCKRVMRSTCSQLFQCSYVAG